MTSGIIPTADIEDGLAAGPRRRQSFTVAQRKLSDETPSKLSKEGELEVLVADPSLSHLIDVTMQEMHWSGVQCPWRDISGGKARPQRMDKVGDSSVFRTRAISAAGTWRTSERYAYRDEIPTDSLVADSLRVVAPLCHLWDSRWTHGERPVCLGIAYGAGFGAYMLRPPHFAPIVEVDQMKGPVAVINSKLFVLPWVPHQTLFKRVLLVTERTVIDTFLFVGYWRGDRTHPRFAGIPLVFAPLITISANEKYHKGVPDLLLLSLVATQRTFGISAFKQYDCWRWSDRDVTRAFPQFPKVPCDTFSNARGYGYLRFDVLPYPVFRHCQAFMAGTHVALASNDVRCGNVHETLLSLVPLAIMCNGYYAETSRVDGPIHQVENSFEDFMNDMRVNTKSYDHEGRGQASAIRMYRARHFATEFACLYPEARGFGLTYGNPSTAPGEFQQPMYLPLSLGEFKQLSFEERRCLLLQHDLVAAAEEGVQQSVCVFVSWAFDMPGGCLTLDTLLQVCPELLGKSRRSWGARMRVFHDRIEWDAVHYPNTGLCRS